MLSFESARTLTIYAFSTAITAAGDTQFLHLSPLERICVKLRVCGFENQGASRVVLKDSTESQLYSLLYI